MARLRRAKATRPRAWTEGLAAQGRRGGRSLSYGTTSEPPASLAPESALAMKAIHGDLIPPFDQIWKQSPSIVQRLANATIVVSGRPAENIARDEGTVAGVRDADP